MPADEQTHDKWMTLNNGSKVVVVTQTPGCKYRIKEFIKSLGIKFRRMSE